LKRDNATIRVGTSGWHYGHWAGTFYPESLPKKAWLDHYASHFDTVELNNTFYHLPRETTVANWATQSPKGFLFAVKASRYITHIKRLKDTGDALQLLHERVTPLKRKLGPILFQLPPSMRKDLALLEDFAGGLPASVLNVFEFRHKSWFSDDLFELMERLGLAFCVHDWATVHTPRVRTGDIVYIRFHGPTGRYGGCYSDEDLAGWAEWISGQVRTTRGVFVYFNNDAQGFALRNAATLLRMLGTE